VGGLGRVVPEPIGIHKNILKDSWDSSVSDQSSLVSTSSIEPSMSKSSDSRVEARGAAQKAGYDSSIDEVELEGAMSIDSSISMKKADSQASVDLSSDEDSQDSADSKKPMQTKTGKAKKKKKPSKSNSGSLEKRSSKR